MRDAILAIIAMLVGLGIGYFVWEGADAESLETTSVNNWPLTQCPPPAAAPQPNPKPTANKKLDDIIAIVDAMLNPPPKALECKTEAAKKKLLTAPNQHEANSWSLMTDHAYAYAMADNWINCRTELDGIH